MKTFNLFFVTSILFATMAIGQAGSVLSLNTITSADVGIASSQAGQFGSSIVSVGDINGDGIEDVAVGAPNLGSVSNQGIVYILFLNSNGSIKDTSKIGFGLSGFTGTIGFGARFGASLAFLGDLDNDGTVEIAIGSPKKTIQSGNEGSIWIISVNNAGLVQKSTEITTGMGGFSGTLSQDEGFGFSLSRMNDVDNDGVPELITGAPDKSLNGTDDGRVYLLKLNSNSTVKSHSVYDNSSSLLNLSGNFRFGEAVSSTNDLDGNGIPEIIVGVPGGGNPVGNTGGVWILFLDNQLNISSLKKIDHQTANFPTDVETLGRLGYSFANLDDIDGDGVDDIAIGVLDGVIDSVSTNLIALLFLNSQGDIAGSTILLAKTGEPFKDLSNPGFDFSGAVVATLKDIDGDGKRDIACGAPIFNSGKGQIHILTLDGVSRIGLEEEPAEPNPITIFPNPTSGSVRVLMPGELSNQTVRITLLDALGRKLWEREFTASGGEPVEFQLDSPPGVYHLHCVGNDFELVKKLIIQD